MNSKSENFGDIENVLSISDNIVIYGFDISMRSLKDP